jgi:uncharacterized membrane protein
MEKILTAGSTRMSGKILKMVQLAILTALLIVMSVTPLGYLKLSSIEISFLMLPVVVGAIVVGPTGGALLGFVFGLTSFLQCVSGISPFGALMWAASPVGAFLVCIPTRVLAGFLPGLLAKAMNEKARPSIIFPAAALIGSLLNTILFLGTVLLIFGGNTAVSDFIGFSAGTSIVAYIAATIGATNGLVEALACTLVGAGLSAAVVKFMPSAKNE